MGHSGPAVVMVTLQPWYEGGGGDEESVELCYHWGGGGGGGVGFCYTTM